MEQQQTGGGKRSVRQMLRAAKNSISGAPLLASEELLQVQPGSGLSVTFVVDRSSSAAADEQAWEHIREEIRRYAVGNLQDTYSELSVLEINGSQIRIAGDFSYPPVFQFEDAARGNAAGLSPVLSAVCVACERAVMRFKPEDDQRHLVIVISDFRCNDDRFVVPAAGGYGPLDLKAVEDRIWSLGCNSVQLIRGRIAHGGDNCPPLPGVSLLFGGDMLSEAGITGGLYRLHHYLAVQKEPALSDQADDPFSLPEETAHTPHRLRLAEIRNIYSAQSVFAENVPDRAPFLDKKLPPISYPVLPVAVLLDISASAVDYIPQMKAAVQHLADSIHNRNGRGSADLAVYAMTADGIQAVRDFSEGTRFTDAERKQLHSLSAENASPVSPLLTAAVLLRRRLAQRTAQWMEAKADILPPLLFLISDFLPNDFTATDGFASVSEMWDLLHTLEHAREQNNSLRIRCIRCGSTVQEIQDHWCRLLTGASVSGITAAAFAAQPDILTVPVLAALEHDLPMQPQAIQQAVHAAEQAVPKMEPPRPQPMPVPRQPMPAPPQPMPVPPQSMPVPPQPMPVPQQPMPVPQQPMPVPQQPMPVPPQPMPVPQQPQTAPPQAAQKHAAKPSGGYSLSQDGWTMNQSGGFVINDNHGRR